MLIVHAQKQGIGSASGLIVIFLWAPAQVVMRLTAEQSLNESIINIAWLG